MKKFSHLPTSVLLALLFTSEKDLQNSEATKDVNLGKNDSFVSFGCN